MAVTTTSNKSSAKIVDSSADSLVGKLRADYPQFIFKSGRREHWSPKTSTITFNPGQKPLDLKYSLLHELAHALLGHRTYQTDFELLKLEAEAWELASKIGRGYGMQIDTGHIQNCLDTYRDWLHRRSTCPDCDVHVLQASSNRYVCFNCGTSWKVSNRRFARPYRSQQVKPGA